MVKKIRKRDGDVVLFQENKIEDAIWKAARAVGGQDQLRSKQLAAMVFVKLDETYGVNGTADIEFVQDSVEKILIEEGHAKVAKAFILYRQSHDELRNVKGLFDTIEVIEDYIGLDDWMVKENSNMGYSLQGLNNYIATKIVSNYWMRRVYPEAIRNVHEAGDLHIHDLGTLGAYCVGWDLKDLLTVGFKGVRGKVESKPPKHLRTALGQMVNFFYTLQGETAGAQAFSNFDTLLAPFIKYDNLTYKQVKQSMQEFVFNLAVPTRVGFQTPFTNITMDLDCPKYMKNEHVIVGGQPQMETYGDFAEEMKMLNKAFAECMLEGDATGQVFTFPIPTYNITKEFDFNNPDYDLIWEMTAKYGIPNFSNYVNSDMNPEDARSMCCRLRIDNTVLQKRGGGLFGANPQTGSIGVVTVNMARLGYLSTDKDNFMARLDKLMELAKESLEIKRKAIENFTKIGLYPYTKFYLRQVNQRFNEYWKNHFSTIGLLGMNEAITNFMPGESIATKTGHQFALDILEFMRNKLMEYQEETGNLYNLEATPGEGTTYRFARMDKKRFGKIKVANEDAYQKGAKPYYTNSTQLPVDFTEDLFEALDLQDELQCAYTGGTNFHAFIGEKMNKDSVRKMVNKISHNYHLSYFTITPTFSICPIHGYLAGEHEYCPKCDEELEEVEKLQKRTPVLSVSDDVTSEVTDDEIAQIETAQVPVAKDVKPEKIVEPIVEKIIEKVFEEVVTESESVEFETPVTESIHQLVSAFGDSSDNGLSEPTPEELVIEETTPEETVSISTDELVEEAPIENNSVHLDQVIEAEINTRVSSFEKPSEDNSREELIADPVITERVSILESSVEQIPEETGFIPLNEQVTEELIVEETEEVVEETGFIPLEEQMAEPIVEETGFVPLEEQVTDSEEIEGELDEVVVKEELLAKSTISEETGFIPLSKQVEEPEETGFIPLNEQAVDESVAEIPEPVFTEKIPYPKNELVDSESVSKSRVSAFGNIGTVSNDAIQLQFSSNRVSAFENVDTSIKEIPAEDDYSAPNHTTDSGIMPEELEQIQSSSSVVSSQITQESIPGKIKIIEPEYEDEEDEEVSDYDNLEEDEEVTSGDIYSNKGEINFGGDTYGENEM